MNVQWNGNDVQTQLMELLARRMQKATVFMQGEVRKKINIGNADGKNPSEPGEPPHKVTGRLFRSIATQVQVSATEVKGIIGTNVEYAPRLEYGFVGTDSRGHNVHQEPRPFLRPTLAEKGAKAMEIVAHG